MVERFYYCQKCKKAVSNKLLKCDSPDCRKNFRNAPTYTMEQIDEMIKSSEAENQDNFDEVANATDNVVNDSLNDDELMMKCPACGKRYSVRETVCQCGMCLVMDVCCEDIIDNFGQPDISLGQVLDDIDWKLKVRRFRNQRIYEEKEINIDRSVFSLGRKYLLENDIFSGDWDEVQDSIGNVSARNAIILVEDGKLYIRMDDKYDNKPVEGKSPVYINGEKLDAGVNMRLHPGNKILMGHYAKETRNLCVEYEVAEVQKQAYGYANEELINKFRDEVLGKISDVESNIEANLEANFGELNKKTDDISKNTTDIKNSTDKISDQIVALSKLQIETAANIDSFMNSWHEQADKITDKSDDEYLKIYFDGYKNYKEIIRCMSDKQRKYILNAAKMEYMVGMAKLEQYAGIFLDVCLLVEDFLHRTVSKILNKVVGDKQIEEKDKRIMSVEEHLEKASAIGSYTCVFAYTTRKTNKTGSTDIGNILFERLVEVVCPNINDEDEKRKWTARVRNTFLKIEKLRLIRNSVCHPDTEDLDKDALGYFTKNQYDEAKKLVFDQSFITEICGYYKKLFK